VDGEVEMTPIATTGHAARRLRQRSIPPVVIDWLIEFGAEEHSHGAVRYSFDKRARRRLRQYVGAAGLKEMNKAFNAYAIVGGDGSVITASYRTRRYYK
jgi:hypothetical protein